MLVLTLGWLAYMALIWSVVEVAATLGRGPAMGEMRAKQARGQGDHTSFTHGS